MLRLDFETMFGFVTATNPGVCSDKVTAEGQSGRNPPEICLTNTGYHSKCCFCFRDYQLINWVGPVARDPPMLAPPIYKIYTQFNMT